LEKSKKHPNEVEREIKGELKYSDIEDIIEYLVATKSHSFSFDVFGADDIAQEIRIICYRALQHFDANRVGKDRWTNFFGRCVDNGLKNLKRDNYIRPSTPCGIECNALHGEQHLITNVAGVCKRWLKDRENHFKRIGIMHPVCIESVGDIVRDMGSDKDSKFRDLKNNLLEKLPKDLHPAFEEMLAGRGSFLTLNQRRKVQKAVKNLLTKNE
jgi:hypothetical protein